MIWCLLAGLLRRVLCSGLVMLGWWCLVLNLFIWVFDWWACLRLICFDLISDFDLLLMDLLVLSLIAVALVLILMFELVLMVLLLYELGGYYVGLQWYEKFRICVLLRVSLGLYVLGGFCFYCFCLFCVRLLWVSWCLVGLFDCFCGWFTG